MEAFSEAVWVFVITTKIASGDAFFYTPRERLRKVVTGVRPTLPPRFLLGFLWISRIAPGPWLYLSGRSSSAR